MRTMQALLAVILAMGALPLGGAAAQSPGATVDPALLGALSGGGRADLFVVLSSRADLSAAYKMKDWAARGRYVWDALNATAQQSQAAVLAAARQRGLEARSLVAANSVFIRSATLADVRALAAVPGVADLHLPRSFPLGDATPTAPSPSSPAVPYKGEIAWGLVDSRATDLWSLGIRGGGIRVAALDTGVQWDHPALEANYGCPDDPGDPACWYDPENACGGEPCDTDGHGTHIIGTLAARDDVAFPHIVGMAPDATWIACLACVGTSCSEFGLTACADWSLAPGGDAARRPHIVNNSWGGAGCDGWFLPVVQAWRASGIFPSFSGGSSGPACGMLSSPSDYQESFATIGHDSARNIGSFSARGPSCYGHDPYTKPNLSAPGAAICSTYPPNSWSCAYSGASMAAAYTSGAAALVLSACPDLVGDVPGAFEALHKGADPAPAGTCGAPPDGEGNSTFGYGYLDALRAANACSAVPILGTLEGHVWDRDGAPVAGATVTIAPEPPKKGGAGPAGRGAQAITGPDGLYRASLLAGTYTVTVAKEGCDAQSVSGVVVEAGRTAVRDFALACVGQWQVHGNLCFDWTRFDGEFYPGDGRVYFLGGRSGANTVGDVYAFDPVSGACFDTGADMPTPVYNYTVSLVNDGVRDLLCAFGGRDATGGATPNVQCYDPAQNAITVLTTLPPDLAGMTPGGQMAVGNQVYVFGGFRTASAPYHTAATYRFNPLTGTWTRLGDLSLGRGYIMAAVVDGKIYAFGGDVYDGTSLTAQTRAERLDPAVGVWDDAAVADLPTACGEGQAFGFDSGAGNPLAGQVVLAGGGQWPGEMAAAILYDVAGNRYEPAFPNLNEARRDHAGFTVTVPAKRGQPLATAGGVVSLWVAGGRQGSDLPPYRPAERFDLTILARTLRVAAIEGRFTVDPYGHTLLRARVLVRDGQGNPAGNVVVSAVIRAAGRQPAYRTRLTRSSGFARFPWKSMQDGTWELCVTDLVKPGWVYTPDQNVVTCRQWQK